MDTARRRVLTTEGWNDPIPYLKIPAKDMQEAVARLLEITSQYQKITQEGIDEFIGKYELNEAEVYANNSGGILLSWKVAASSPVLKSHRHRADESFPTPSEVSAPIPYL